MIIDQLEKKGLISPPPFVVSNTAYLVITGSVAYGVADTSVKSRLPDNDVYGYCLPPKKMIFNYEEIRGFGTPNPGFEQWQKHGIIDHDAHGGIGQEWDFSIFNIVKYFELCREGNPNMIDTLFVPENCILHCTPVGRLVRDNRKMFISKEVWKKFRGYAWSQMHKMQSKFDGSIELAAIIEMEDALNIPRKTTLQEAVEHRIENLTESQANEYLKLYQSGMKVSGRFEMRKRFGYDVKFGYHLIRLLDEAQQLIETGEMDLQRAREAMKSVRRGEWKIDDLIDWAKQKEKELDIAFTNCKLPDKAPEDKLKVLLIECLEEHYGNLSDSFQQPNWAIQALEEMDRSLAKIRNELYGGKPSKPWWKVW